jgi:hypothetical protein
MIHIAGAMWIERKVVRDREIPVLFDRYPIGIWFEVQRNGGRASISTVNGHHGAIRVGADMQGVLEELFRRQR